MRGNFDKRLDAAWWALRIGLGVGPIIVGLDKFFNKIVDWGMYLSPLATKVVPVSTATFMHAVGVIEIIAGLLVFIRPAVGAVIVGAWLALIAITLLTGGQFLDVAVRDLVMAIGAFCLAKIWRSEH